MGTEEGEVELKLNKKVIKKAWFRVSTVKPLLLWILLFCVVWVLLWNTWLNNRPAPNKFAASLGILFYSICLAFIPAFVFYFLNVHLQTYNKKVKLLRYANNTLLKINSLSRDLLVCMRVATGAPLSEYKTPEKQVVDNYCANINPHLPVVISLGNIPFPNWFQLFHYIHLETKRISNDLYKLLDFFDADTLELLTCIEDHLENFLDFSKGLPSAYNNLSQHSEFIYTYLVYCDNLTSLFRKKFNKHDKEYHMNYKRIG